MSNKLMQVISTNNLKEIGKNVSNLISLTFKSNNRNDSKSIQAVCNNGITMIKTITKSGVVSQTVIKLPKITSILERNNIIKDLYKQRYTQEVIAKIVNVSQATVSNVLKKN